MRTGYSLAVLSAALMAGCAMERAEDAPQDPEPLKEDVPPIHDTAMTVLPTFNFTYTPKDRAGAIRLFQDAMIERLNADGAAENNRFSIASGVRPNFNFAFTIYNDGNERFTGSLAMDGWGWGYITTFSTEFSYNHGDEMVEALTAKAYVFIKQGWRDSRKNR